VSEQVHTQKQEQILRAKNTQLTANYVIKTRMLHTITEFFFRGRCNCQYRFTFFPNNEITSLKINSTKQQEINCGRTPITTTEYPMTMTFQCIEEKLTNVTGKRLAINHLSTKCNVSDPAHTAH